MSGIFGRKRILVHGWQCACSQSPENYKDQNEVTLLEWPAQSPDLNIIENISLNIKVILKFDLPNTVVKLSRVKCKQTPPHWKWRILMKVRVKRRNEFAEWHVAWLAELHNYAECKIWKMGQRNKFNWKACARLCHAFFWRQFECAFALLVHLLLLAQINKAEQYGGPHLPRQNLLLCLSSTLAVFKTRNGESLKVRIFKSGNL